MKKTSVFVRLMLITGLAAMIGCGGGDGGDAAPPPTKAIVTLSTTGTLPSGVQIGGIQAKINLPAGVTAKASPSVLNNAVLFTDTGVVVATGSATGAEFVTGVYSTGTTTVTYAVSLGVSKNSGFSTGEFAQVTCEIAVGSAPSASDFSISDVTIKEQTTLATITGLTPEFTVTFQ